MRKLITAAALAVTMLVTPIVSAKASKQVTYTCDTKPITGKSGSLSITFYPKSITVTKNGVVTKILNSDIYDTFILWPNGEFIIRLKNGREVLAYYHTGEKARCPHEEDVRLALIDRDPTFN